MRKLLLSLALKEGILFLVYMYLYLIAFQKDFVVNYKNTYIPTGQDN